MQAAERTRRIRTFLLIWSGQTVSALGTGLTSFALGVWVYQSTGSTTRYALIAFFTIAPRLLVLPLVGAVIDRYDRRSVMILSNLGAGLGSGTIALLLWLAQLEIWQIYVIAAVSSLFRGFQSPAFAASTTLLVPKRHFTRASALVHMGSAGTEILAPLLAGVLVQWIELQGVVLLDLATFVFSALTLVAVKIPMPEGSSEETSAEGGGESLLRQSLQGFTYLRARPGLLGLVALFAGANFMFGMLYILITPWVLSFASPAGLGVVLSAASAGQLAGSLVMSVWGGPRRRVRAIFALLAAQSLALPFGLLPAGVPLLAGIAFFFFFLLPMIGSLSQAIWQTKVAPELQGRVFTIRRTLTMVLLPVAYLVTGALADTVFEPLMAPGGALAATLGPFLGTGAGRGMALMAACLGLVGLAVVAQGWRYRPLRRLEDELPDAVTDADVA